MKRKFVLALLMIFLFKFNCFSQTYYPLPTHDAYWMVYEFDENLGVYDDKMYSVIGDTIVNGLYYTKVYQLNDYPTIYDTIRKLHCLMRQDSIAKKIWFIRTYLNEVQEKLGYDLLVNVGDTISLPAFDYGNAGDSIYYLQGIYQDGGTLANGSHRPFYSFPSITSNGHWIGYVEGIGQLKSTYPNLHLYYDAFHQSFTRCLNINNNYVWPGDVTPIDSLHCGFNLVGIREVTNSKNLLYPNPFSDKAELSFETGVFSEFQLIDLLGNIVLTANIQNYQSNYILKRNNLNSGLYLGKMIGKSKDIVTFKIVIY